MTRSLLRMKRLYASIAVLAVVSALSILAPAGMVHTQTRDLLEGASTVVPWSHSGTVDDDDDAIGDKEFHGPPDLEDTDVIIRPGRWGNPLVVEKYKLVFFAIPKVACTEWKLLFRRILGFSPDWDPEISIQLLHNPSYNGLTYLSSYTKEEAQEMLTSEDWTRAVFVREPKERILSAFLDKMVVNSSFFKLHCCNEKRMGLSDPKARDYCNSRTNAEDFSYFLKRTLDCPNEHWDSQANAIDRKWWTMMNFVGYMDNVADDAQRLLQSIKSIDGKTAWDQHGKTGWGESGKSAFMVRDTAHHVTNAHDKLRKYYTECEEVFVEKHWASEWEQEAYHFDKIQLFDGKDLSECGDVLD